MNNNINIKEEASEYFAHNPKSEGVVFIMIDKSLIGNKENVYLTIYSNCDFHILDSVDNNKGDK